MSDGRLDAGGLAPDDPRESPGLLERVKTFLEEQPLLVRLDLPGTVYRTMIQPQKLELQCPTCDTARRFRETGPQRGPGYGSGGSSTSLTTNVYVYEYKCTGCETAMATFFVEVHIDQLDVTGNSNWLRKVGQAPPWSIAIPAELKKELGENTSLLYKRALICLSLSYGLGACAYLRRVLEDHINPLLQLIHDLRKQNGAPAAELNKLKQAIKSKAFDKKTDAAYRFLPASIVVDGLNPLKIIHDQLSVGVHGLDENECTAVAFKLRTSLEFVVRELRRQLNSKNEFVKGLKAAVKRGRP